ncbi:MAG: hypothetical protein QM652_06125 [Legionella sp.]|uniref:hypothetical protein n=1 Tax=Legionella sp. TaxID=459 RepID=UPI0039E39490
MQNNFNLNINPLHLANPLQQIMELNQRTLKKFSYLESQELTHIHDPKALLEKNVELFIDNTHTSIDYMHQLFNILGNSWVNLSQETEKKTKDLMQHTQSAATSGVNKLSGVKSRTQPAKSASSSRKKASHLSSHSSKTHTSKVDSPEKAMTSAAKKEDSHKTQ